MIIFSIKWRKKIYVCFLPDVAPAAGHIFHSQTITWRALQILPDRIRSLLIGTYIEVQGPDLIVGPDTWAAQIIRVAR